MSKILPIDSLSLIANSGVQFFRFECNLDLTQPRQFKFQYVEGFDMNRTSFWPDPVINIKDLGISVRKSELVKHALINHKGELKTNFDEHLVKPVDDPFDSENADNILRKFQKRWIPLPYFKKNNIDNKYFGPTDWVRIWLERIDNDKVQGVLLIDTATTRDENDRVTPFIHENPNENTYSLCQDEDLILSFVDNTMGCGWVEDYIRQLYYKPNEEPSSPFMRHIAAYVSFIKIVKSLNKIPEIQIYTDETGSIDVDLVLDVGNTNTCAILFENPSDVEFNFNTVKRLEITDFSNPLSSYSRSFPTRLIFKDSEFGVKTTDKNTNLKFRWPSPIRIGFEADRLINSANVEFRMSREIRTFSSSPKRYLWDNKPSHLAWEYDPIEKLALPSDVHKVHKRGISEQLTNDGSVCEDGISGFEPKYSRKSLMTFVYLEIISHAFRQINSVEFRGLHGAPNKKRRIRRIIISCPTGMLKQEQIALRQCAADALLLLNNFNDTISPQSRVPDIWDTQVEIIPPVSDLKKSLDNLEQRKHWMYDEATAAQLVMIYSFIQHKFDGNPDLFFNLFGKLENTHDVHQRKTITIGSLDIGGGTSDIMICKYDYFFDNATELHPKPIYWESINLAGDDLVQSLIQWIIIEGSSQNQDDLHCAGVIEEYMIQNQIPSIGRKLNGFFGRDSNNIGFRGKLMRTKFINQIAQPIIQRYMASANSKHEIELNYEQIFPNEKPNKELLDYFRDHFGFSFEALKWNISPKKTNAIIQSVFGKLMKQVAGLMHLHVVDILVLSGGPSQFNQIEELIQKYHPLPPNRIINLNKHWIGRWYPFADNNGFIDDPKTIVSIGSLIAHMGGVLYKLNKFKISTEELKRKLTSTADFIGIMDEGIVAQPILTPQKSENSFTVHSIPCVIGMKKINAKNYPARHFLSLGFNDDKLRLNLGGREGADINSIVESFKVGLRGKMPFTVTISRDYSTDKEKIKLEEIVDNEGNTLNKQNFELELQSLASSDGYWLDSGEFILDIKN